MKIKIFFLVFLLVNAGFSLAQLPSTLYIVGNASPIGWHIENALALETVSTGVYKYSGPLFVGTYKFANNQNSCWCQDFYVKDANDATKVVKNGTDNQWSVDALAQFDVTVNLNTMSINVQQTSATPSYNNFWIIGDATPAGWSMDGVINQKFSKNPNNSSEYYYQGNFSAGEFKIFMGAFNDFGGSFYMPITNHQDFSNISAQMVNNPSFDYKWQITSPGNYTVIVNPGNNTVSVSSGLTLSESIAKEKNLIIYPNPSKGIVFLQSKEKFANTPVQIYNLEGREVAKLNITNNQINTANLKTGTYILKIENNKEKYSAKIIVK